MTASVQTQRFDEVFAQLATLGLSDRCDVDTQNTSLTLSRGETQLEPGGVHLAPVSGQQSVV